MLRMSKNHTSACAWFYLHLFLSLNFSRSAASALYILSPAAILYKRIIRGHMVYQSASLSPFVIPFHPTTLDSSVKLVLLWQLLPEAAQPPPTMDEQDKDTWWHMDDDADRGWWENNNAESTLPDCCCYLSIFQRFSGTVSEGWKGIRLSGTIDGVHVQSSLQKAYCAVLFYRQPMQSISHTSS